MRAAQSFLVPVIALDTSEDRADPGQDRALHRRGRGAGARPDTGPNTIAVVIVVGWPRQ